MARTPFLFFLLTYLLGPAKGHNTACNVGIPTLCLEGNATYEGVRGVVRNEAKFWFGTPFLTTCPDGKQGTVLCDNPATTYRSVITRMRMSDNNETDSIGQVLGVHYPIGGKNTTLKVCGSSLLVAGPTSGYAVDATHTVSTNAWLLQVQPHVWWNASLSPNGTKFTLVYWDPGHFQLHGMWVNIQTAYLPTNAQELAATEVVPFRGPANYFMTTSGLNPYTLALFEQRNITTINVTEAYEYVAKSQRTVGYVSMADLMTKFQLTGPIGVSTLQMKVDEFLADMGLRRQVINNCPALRTTGLISLFPAYNFTGATGTTLSVSVDAVFESPAETVSACCTSAPFIRESRMSDSKLEQEIPPFVTRSQPAVNLIQTYIQEEPFYFIRRRFTLLLVDFTDVTATDLTAAMLHWQVINIKDPKLETGETALNYFPPIPVSGTRKMAFFLLEQTRDLTAPESLGSFSSQCNNTALGKRCKFDLLAMMKNLTMSLKGITGFKSNADLWSRQQAVSKLGLSNAAACNGVAGFAVPCPSPTTPTPAGQASLAAPTANLALWTVVASWSALLSFFIA